MAVLENISTGRRGLAVFLAVPIEVGVAVNILIEQVALQGYVRQCCVRTDGYLVGLELDEHCQLTVSSLDSFIPEHLVDIDTLKLE